MNHVLLRPLSVAVCLLLTLAAGSAWAAPPLPQRIIAAENPDGEMREQMEEHSNRAMDGLLSADPEQIAEARDDVVRTLENDAATAGFLEAYSAMLTARLGEAIDHEELLVRVNAMIMLRGMVDQGSRAMLTRGRADENPGVQRLAMQALHQRVLWWQEQGGNAQDINNAVNEVIALLNQRPAPHSIVVAPALRLLYDVPGARDALIQQIIERAALHTDDPNLSYAGERDIIARLAYDMSLNFSGAEAPGIIRAAFLYSQLITNQLQADAINNNARDDAIEMLRQSAQALGQICAGARKRPPADQTVAVSEWIPSAQWDDLENLLMESWVPILRTAPFGLDDQELGVEAEGDE